MQSSHWLKWKGICFLLLAPDSKGDFIMRRIMLSALLALAGLALALGQPPKTDEEKAVRAAIDSYTAAYNKGDLASLLAHVAPDVDLIEETGTKHTGKANLAEL